MDQALHRMPVVAVVLAIMGKDRVAQAVVRLGDLGQPLQQIQAVVGPVEIKQLGRHRVVPVL